MTMDRKDLLFSSGTDSCAAWLYPAAGGAGPGPVVVMAHGLSGTRRDQLGPFAERFAAGGIAALVFDYRGFGDSTGEPDLRRIYRRWVAELVEHRQRPGNLRAPSCGTTGVTVP
jgi:pimeloyl-ACP methyl ester carboxylesterase